MKLHTLLRELTRHAENGRLNHQVVVMDPHGHEHFLLGSGESVEWSDEQKAVYLHVDDL